MSDHGTRVVHCSLTKLCLYGFLASRTLIDALMRVGTIYDIRATRPRARPDGLRIWVVLPFHPVWHRALQHAVLSFSKDPTMVCLLRHVSAFRCFLDLQPSWKNYLPAHGDLLAQNGWKDRG